MKSRKQNPIKWLCLILFTLYVSGMSLFTHTHIINNTQYIHSHPFAMNGDGQEHDHTENELLLLDQIFNTTITANILPDINPTGEKPTCILIYAFRNQTLHKTGPGHRIRLRAPPSAA